MSHHQAPSHYIDKLAFSESAPCKLFTGTRSR